MLSLKILKYYSNIGLDNLETLDLSQNCLIELENKVYECLTISCKLNFSNNPLNDKNELNKID